MVFLTVIIRHTTPESRGNIWSPVTLIERDREYPSGGGMWRRGLSSYLREMGLNDLVLVSYMCMLRSE